MILCRNGHANPDGATVCSVCGVPIGSPAAAQQAPPPSAPPAQPRVSLSESSLSGGSGGECRCEVRVENPGQAADEYELTLLGEAAPFGVLEPASLSLAAGAAAVSWLTFRGPPTTALAYEVRVSSKQGAASVSVHGRLVPAEPAPAETAPAEPAQAQPLPPPPKKAGRGIFICYRREDAYPAGRIKDRLEGRFGKDRVFLDVDALAPGTDYARRIREAIDSAGAAIIVISGNWAAVADEHGHRRLDNPNDFVRLEVRAALTTNTLVIPVLVQGATMPTSKELPPDLVELAGRHALHVSDVDFDAGMQRLIDTLNQSLPDQGPPPPPPKGLHLSAVAGQLVLAIAGAALFAVGLFLVKPDGHTFLANDFGGSARHGGLFTSLSPISVVLGAIAGAILLRHPPARRLGAGLLVGFAVSGTAKYVAVAGWANSPAARAEGYSVGKWILVLLGGPLLVAAAVWAVSRSPWVERRTNDLVSIGLALGGAALIIAGCVLPFAQGGPEQTIVHRDWDRVDPFVTAAAIAAIALVPRRWGIRELWFGALIALGAASSLLWVRYIGVPLLRGDTLKYGAFLGLVGAALAVVAGALGARSAAEVRLGDAPQVKVGSA